eukprot:CAMPEP_0114625114 /NCGR_PEP_ID=MMETSP0168-20121206/11107_1 /TAXON_ID=95228 ORGANISM="Vannella sp., Strain DIVA3 517/6/12" /NCGR_SAMPLE_ID=MMETSP0168 /ASSEMBLY_ACC=CAM_ASM_000044 /LENGTH=407 /DNA_ID=CAMNT_0001836393 /DNA_START=151 /DNA_END=1371 /DNA_ORIENTATION=+
MSSSGKGKRGSDGPSKSGKSKRSKREKDGGSGSDDGALSSSMSAMQLSGSKKAKRKASHTSLTIEANGFTYVTDRIAGNGSFGVVFQATCSTTGQVVAIKKVLQDKRFKNRELQIMKVLSHPNVCKLENSFYTSGENDDVFLNLVLEYVPETIHRVARHYSKLKKKIPIFYCKLYMYQLARALNYIHSLGICHRDIKPQNLLLNPRTGVLKLCDFGSAKVLVPDQANVAYICSRYYRAPELIFGATDYTHAIDVWSMGCVMGEILLGQPLFPGASAVDQLVEIIKVLGTPTKEQIHSMNRNYTEFRFPMIPSHPFDEIFGDESPEANDLMARLLAYTPTLRLNPLEVCAHPFFDELREPGIKLPNGRELPPLFDFSEDEWASIVRAGLQDRLLPVHLRVGVSSDDSS